MVFSIFVCEMLVNYLKKVQQYDTIYYVTRGIASKCFVNLKQ